MIRKMAALMLAGALVLIPGACSRNTRQVEVVTPSASAVKERAETNAAVPGTEEASLVTGYKIRLVFDTKEIVVALEDTPVCEELMAQLPLKLQFEDYAEIEKIGYLPQKLSVSDAPGGCDPSVGTMAYYVPWGNIVLFYGDRGYADGLIPLGTVESGVEALSDLDSGFDVTIETINE
ncbi:MAG: cyclophilin-like fold protein [Christensenella sp.]|uniref:cyclophilin-like fold protein n=1 Tax=Christensenella sp. TaxID=1935934 RepID=UPI002B21AF0A|nr:cyclophilin-like fold protein [Christensenella sp.]MEA5002164.1 cyclophilin-like fold protein [Christensenella sp.]